MVWVSSSSDVVVALCSPLNIHRSPILVSPGSSNHSLLDLLYVPETSNTFRSPTDFGQSWGQDMECLQQPLWPLYNIMVSDFGQCWDQKKGLLATTFLTSLYSMMTLDFGQSWDQKIELLATTFLTSLQYDDHWLWSVLRSEKGLHTCKPFWPLYNMIGRHWKTPNAKHFTDWLMSQSNWLQAKTSPSQSDDDNHVLYCCHRHSSLLSTCASVVWICKLYIDLVQTFKIGTMAFVKVNQDSLSLAPPEKKEEKGDQTRVNLWCTSILLKSNWLQHLNNNM